MAGRGDGHGHGRVNGGSGGLGPWLRLFRLPWKRMLGHRLFGLRIFGTTSQIACHGEKIFSVRGVVWSCAGSESEVL